jgi:hypothetical protein
MRTCRQVIEGKEFTDLLAGIEANAKRADELIDGIKWALSKDPRQGKCVLEPVWMISSSKYANMKPLSVYYAFNDRTVFLLSVKHRN